MCRGERRGCATCYARPSRRSALARRPDGLVRILPKKAYRDGTAAVEMDPLSLLCRLASSVPPPRLHTVRYAGVLACWRAGGGAMASADHARAPRGGAIEHGHGPDDAETDDHPARRETEPVASPARHSFKMVLEASADPAHSNDTMPRGAGGLWRDAEVVGKLDHLGWRGTKRQGVPARVARLLHPRERLRLASEPVDKRDGLGAPHRVQVLLGWPQARLAENHPSPPRLGPSPTIRFRHTAIA